MKYVALLRGINIGGRFIKMEELKKSLSDLGFKNTSTVLQTGNYLFESTVGSKSLKQIIESRLTDNFKYAAIVQVIEIPDLEMIVKNYPFSTQDKNNQNYVVFFENNMEKKLNDELTNFDSNFEKIMIGQGVIYWQVQKGYTLKTIFAKNLTKAKYKNINTNRNLNTLQKILVIAQ